MAARAKPPSPILGAAAALIGEASATLAARDSRFQHSFEAPLARIRPDPAQPRRRFDEADIAALAATMAERGQLQPILLRRDPEAREGWIIVAGERRFRAAQRNGWDHILAIAHDGDPEVAGLVENLQRVDLTPLEEARGLQRLIVGKGWTQDRAARALGKSKAEISATLRILSLPGRLLEEVLTSEPDLPKNTLVELARIEAPAVRARLLALARAGGLTVRAIRAARAQAERQARDGEAPSEPAALPDARSIERLIGALAAAAAAGVSLPGSERARLVRLREAISALLD